MFGIIIKNIHIYKKMKKRVFLLFVLLGAVTMQTLFAQSFQVRGRVVSSEDNEPLVGVGVMQEGTSNGVPTDIDGRYSIEIKSQGEATLVFSYMGYVTKRIKVKGANHNLNVTMEPEAIEVDEVVVVAYGVRKKVQFRVRCRR